MDIRKTRTCERCRTQVPLVKVRLFPKTKDQNILVCESCSAILKQASMGKLTNTQPKEEPIRNIYQPKERSVTPFRPKDAPRASPVKKESAPSIMKSLFCTRCKYPFRVNKEKAGILYRMVCPYCGKADKITPSS